PGGTGALPPHLARVWVGRRARWGALCGIEAGLLRRPVMAFVLVLGCLIRALAILRIGDEIGADRFLRRSLLVNFRRRLDGLVLADRTVVNIVDVVSVVVGDAVPPERRVVQRQGGEVQAQPHAAPAPAAIATPIPAAPA